jgi:hypothetical protein
MRCDASGKKWFTVLKDVPEASPFNNERRTLDKLDSLIHH